MQAFVESEVTKDELLDSLRAHIAADRLRHGFYWSPGRKQGCAVGCTIHDFAPGQESGHDIYPRLFGIHQDVAYLVDTIFECLEPPHDTDWPKAFVEAVNVGADLFPIQHGIALWLLRDERSPYAKHRSLPWVEHAAEVVEDRWVNRVNADDAVIVDTNFVPRTKPASLYSDGMLDIENAVVGILQLSPIDEVLDTVSMKDGWVALSESILEMVRTIK